MIPVTAADAFVRLHLRRNLAALGADYALFMIGLSFASQSTILPAFAAHLGAPNVVIGAIPAVMTIGWFLPPLFAAGHTEALARKLPFVLRHTGWERAPFLVLAAAAFLVADRAPALTLAVMLLMLLMVTGVGGVLLPAWMDVVGRAIPVTVRGRFFAVASLAAGAGGLAGSVLVTHILAAVPAPAGFGLCFLAASACMALSWGALALTREPPGAAAAPRVGLRTHLGRAASLLRGDRNLSWFLAARAWAIVGMMTGGFFTVYALQTWRAPAGQVGVFTMLLLAGQMAGNVALGWLADRAGHRLVIMVGTAATVTANVLALSAASLEAFGAVFVLAGVQMAAINVSNLNVLLEFAPAPDERPTYIGLGSTAMAPVAFGAPLLAGVLADVLGFRSLFVGAALAGSIALGVLATRVRDPRRARPGRRVQEAGA